MIDWQNPEANDFAIAEEVSIEGENKKRPDIVLYVNGIALGVIELKRSSVSVSEGIRQNLDNQKKDFIRSFFTTMQLVMAGNDTQGLRYGVIETPELLTGFDAPSAIYLYIDKKMADHSLFQAIGKSNLLLRNLCTEDDFAFKCGKNARNDGVYACQ